MPFGQAHRRGKRRAMTAGRRPARTPAERTPMRIFTASLATETNTFSPVPTDMNAFKAAFPDFNPQADYYLTVAFSFHGKAVEVAGQPALALGLENFSPDGPDLDITIAHEQFHLYHFATFSASGGLYRGVWSEGMAVFGSTEVQPGYRLSQYLGFTGSQVNSMYDMFYDLADDIRSNLSSTDQTLKRAYLGAEANDTWIPPGSGYYIGFYVVEALANEGNTVAAMARWDADTVYQNMERILPTLEP